MQSSKKECDLHHVTDLVTLHYLSELATKSYKMRSCFNVTLFFGVFEYYCLETLLTQGTQMPSKVTTFVKIPFCEKHTVFTRVYLKSTSCISQPPIFKVKNLIAHHFGLKK